MELLNEITPGDGPKRSDLLNSGAEAVECAVKVARSYTRRPAIMVFEGGCHGRTNLSIRQGPPVNPPGATPSN